MKKIIALLLGLLMLCSLACAKEATSAPAAEKTEIKEETNVDKTHPIATITMKDGGVIELELYPEIAPESVKNFISLSNSGFYDGLIFHRVIAGFMIQGGDPTGTGAGGSEEEIPGEFASNGYPNPIRHVRGTISMARTMDPNSASSQFFIMHQDAPYLDGQYAAFGHVVEGMETVDEIAETDTDASDRPKKTQRMKRVYIED